MGKNIGLFVIYMNFFKGFCMIGILVRPEFVFMVYFTQYHLFGLAKTLIFS